MATTGTAQQEKLDEIVARIVAAVDPLRIILFGSAARGDARPDSDVDVLVVMPEGTPRRDTAALLYPRMAGLRTPVDILVAWPSDLDRYRATKGLVYRNVVREGRSVYVRPDA
jgi:predicted nucleotidyltransferase